MTNIGANASINAENRRLLAHLDSIITYNSELVKEKEIRLNGLSKALSKASSDGERLSLCGMLYDEYVVFDSDSALFYASKARSILEKAIPDDYDLIANWKLKEAFIYTVLGLYDTTMTLLKEIDSSRLSDRTKSKYFESMSYIHSMRSVYVQSDKKMREHDLDYANRYRDSIKAMHLPPTTDWVWVPVAAAIEGKNQTLSDKDLRNLITAVDTSNSISRQNAINSYWLSRYYENNGDEARMIKYKTLAAINDALIVNREIAAIQELAGYLYNKGELNRAYNYLTYADNQVNLYHNRYRIVNLSDVLPSVRDSYNAELERRDRRMSAFVLILSILTVVLIASIVFIVVEFRKLKKMRNLLTEANSHLKTSVRERDDAIVRLEKTNNDLNEANKQKLSLLAYAFKLTTMYINALEDYRKKLLKKYKVKRIDDLGVLINDPELIKELYHGFYEGFDHTVLSIFPNFIEEYNKTVSESSRFSPEAIASSKALNTKLRIYALRRLGISKSAEIAEMLNVSIRTVYNNRGGASDEPSDKQQKEE